MIRVPFLPLLALAAAAWIGGASQAAATAISINEFSVTNGIVSFTDTFAQDTSLSGGTGTVVASGSNFSGGTPANYVVYGTIPESSANNGQALLDTTNGVLRALPSPPFLPLISHTDATLVTAISDPLLPSALTPARALTVTGLFDLTAPGVVGGTAQIYLTNDFPLLNIPGNVLSLRLRNCVAGSIGCATADGIALQLILLDYVNHTGHLVDQIVLSAADLLNPLLELQLQKNAGTDVVNAFYGFGGPLTLLGSTTAGCSDVFTNGCSLTPSYDTVRAGFGVFEPVPEPSSFIMMSGALLVLGALMLRRRRRA